MTTRRYDIVLQPLSHNHAYPSHFWIVTQGKRKFATGSRYLSTEGEAYKLFIQEILEIQDLRYGSKLVRDWYEISFIFLWPEVRSQRDGPGIFFANGTLKPLDPSNMIKLAEDAMSEYWGVDDRHNISIHGYKRIAEDEVARMIILVSGCNLRDPVYHRGNPVALEYKD